MFSESEGIAFTKKAGKLIVTGFVFFAALQVLVSTTAAYTNAEYGFSYTPPPGWTTDTSRSSGEVVSFKDPASPAMISVAVDTSPGVTLEGMVSSSKAEVSQQQQVPFQFVSEKAITIDNRPGRELLYSANMMGIGIREKMDFVMNNDTVFVFFLTVPSTGPTVPESLFDSSIGTITFISPDSLSPGPSSAVLPPSVTSPAQPDAPVVSRSTVAVTSPRQSTRPQTVPGEPVPTTRAPVDPWIILPGLAAAGIVQRFFSS